MAIRHGAGSLFLLRETIALEETNMDDREDAQLHLNLLWHAMAERLEAQLDQFERLNRLMIDTGVFQEEVILGPIIGGQESGPPWTEDADTVVQAAVHLSVGMGIVRWTYEENDGFVLTHEQRVAESFKRFVKLSDCNLAIRVRFASHVQALIDQLQAKLRIVAQECRSNRSN